MNEQQAKQKAVDKAIIKYTQDYKKFIEDIWFGQPPDQTDFEGLENMIKRNSINAK